MDLREIDHLLELARMKIDEKEKEKLSLELESILNYVKQLNEIDTLNTQPISGGSFLSNILREDENVLEFDFDFKSLKKAGYKNFNDYFEIPPIFE